MSNHRRRASAGFTLIETLIATALMVAIMAALATVTAQWLPNWNRGFARVQRTELLSLGLERVVADLAAAEYVPAHYATRRPLFEGRELAVTFVRTAVGPNTRAGLEIVRIAEAADARGLALLRTEMPFAPVDPNLGVDLRRLTDPVVLVRAPFRLSFSYAGTDRVWKPTWLDAGELPAAVRVTVRNATTGQILSVSTAALLHVTASAECVRAKSKRNCVNPTGEDSDRPGAKPAQQL
ncbi:MAG TPA: prepilin-type N-terminal cleavage/methylation domain-containing protein [Xanthobacteraceae bacterium]|jgi:general secretion pathway protein J|nr:prepilin-type N-terminal cleavage/methylation domain-containing protein [Xanthobacteraceae bacterium]